MRPQLWMDSENGGVEAGIHSPLEFAFIAVGANGKEKGRLEMSLRIEPLVITPKALQVNKIDLSVIDPVNQLTNQKFAISKYRDWMSKMFYTKYFTDPKSGKTSPVFDKPSKENMPFFCGHNTSYDRAFLRAFLGSDYDMCYYHVIDTMVFANLLFSEGKLPGLENMQNETIAKYFCLPPPRMYHNAMCDIEQTRKNYECLRKILNGATVDQVRRENENQPSLPFDVEGGVSKLSETSVVDAISR